MVVRTTQEVEPYLVLQEIEDHMSQIANRKQIIPAPLQVRITA